MGLSEIRVGFTFDDVLLVPKRSSVRSRQDVSLRTRVSTNVTLDIPVLSANMDTVTESDMATAMSELGGIGIIHRFLGIEEQAEQVVALKPSSRRWVVARAATAGARKSTRGAAAFCRPILPAAVMPWSVVPSRRPQRSGA